MGGRISPKRGRFDGQHGPRDGGSLFVRLDLPSLRPSPRKATPNRVQLPEHLGFGPMSTKDWRCGNSSAAEAGMSNQQKLQSLSVSEIVWKFVATWMSWIGCVLTALTTLTVEVGLDVF